MGLGAWGMVGGMGAKTDRYGLDQRRNSVSEDNE